MMTQDETDLLSDLTDPQREAVTCTEGPLLVLAAAGSGKTRVITRRAAYLVRACGIAPWNVLSITFTNKAAGEMRDRVARLLSGRQAQAMNIGTFHATCAKLLRRYAPQAGVSGDFVIYDAADQKSAMKQAFKERDISTNHFEPAAVAATISSAKNQLTDADAYAVSAGDFYEKTVARVYRKYEQMLAANNALDFDDLLLRTARLLQRNLEVRTELQDRYTYVQVDEYQDTNHAQFIIAHLLADKSKNLCVVGDPDQSIYGWRGANIHNILEFEKHFPGARVIKLGQNYRSTPQILKVADTLIRNNRQRKHKDLFTHNPAGADVRIVQESDEETEARYVVDFLRKHNGAGVPWGQMAVFYRINALSRVMEESLLHQAIPYVVARGTAFYQRAEVKDAMAFLRIIANPGDEVSLTRVVNTPPRGIGDGTVEALRAHAAAQNIALFEAMQRASSSSCGVLANRAAVAVGKFAQMLQTWRHKVLHADEMKLGFVPGVRDVVEMVLRDSLLEAFYKEGKHADEDKLNNLYELVSAAQRFDEQYGADITREPHPSPLPKGEGREGSEGSLLQRLHAYLESVTLVSDVDAVSSSGGAVTLMTLHAAKGLEFQVVAMIGLEEGLLPHARARDNGCELEEERRLCFVGITRAQQHLLLTHARYRTIRGLKERAIFSPFLKELGTEGVVREDRAVFGDSAWDQPRRFKPWEPQEEAQEMGPSLEESPENHEGGLAVGARVKHPKFGPGRVISLSPASHPSRAKVYFDRFGAKTLVLEYARLEVVD